MLLICKIVFYNLQFQWTPFTADVLSELPNYCVRDMGLWSVTCPLINFDVVEFHYPGRVMRQFGLVQEIPEPLESAIWNRLHRMTRQGLKGVDWRERHAAHIDSWNARRDHVLRGSPAFGSMDYHSPYMVWYRTITRLLVGNPSHRPAHGVRPVAATHELWVRFGYFFYLYCPSYSYIFLT